METSFTDKAVLVTGAGRGIGRDIAKKLAECGARVYALSKTKSHLDSLAEEHANITTICVDLTDWNETRNVLQQLPVVHGLVNNAGVAILSSFLDATPEEFDIIFNTNVKSIINVSQVVAKKMLEENVKGSIVNISSQASMAALKNHALYCGTKGALDSITRVMALELGPHNIRVNCVNPTVVMTEMGRLGWSDPQKSQEMLSKIPLGRFAEVEDVVNAVFFLLSDKSSMCNGVMLPIDGGFLAC
ncbi:hypothetical protein RUM44_007876 [Polyplax serrata]|uniref:L-xylulose reductase n=1 Tax=Polyplax serrata TaxID=468196 RepID=A0ABR1BAQ3_POLSC